jgi:hypothetical protein
MMVPVAAMMPVTVMMVNWLCQYAANRKYGDNHQNR